jgi:hypothetical protein
MAENNIVEEAIDLLSRDYGHTYKGLLLDDIFIIQQQIDKALKLHVRLDIQPQFVVNDPSLIARINWK